MTLIRNLFPVLIIAGFMFPAFVSNAVGQESFRRGDQSLCKIGEVMRRVEIQYYEQEKAVPCEVHYYKQTEEPGEDRVLWRAEYETGFCENKMTAFVDELTSLGWYCESEADVPPALQLEGALE